MASELTWANAIEQVLRDEQEAMHYKDIAELISERNYRADIGATPSYTVSSILTTDIKNKGDKSRFVRVGIGEYVLREFLSSEPESKNKKGAENISDEREISLVECYGIFWERDQVVWKRKPDLLGVQQRGAIQVNFSDQVGFYLLHDGRETIYVGQAIEQTIGQRLTQHTEDRLRGRWNRFSWFGFHRIQEKGTIDSSRSEFNNISINHLADIFEAVLIESIEPRQNRKKGNNFSDREYLQVEDPEIKRKIMKQLWDELGDKI